MNESLEIYSLRLEHYIQDESGRHAIDEPFLVRVAYERSHPIPAPVCINHMLDEMRREVLRRTANVE